jgi:hypothetical protein
MLADTTRSLARWARTARCWAPCPRLARADRTERMRRTGSAPPTLSLSAGPYDKVNGRNCSSLGAARDVGRTIGTAVRAPRRRIQVACNCS